MDALDAGGSSRVARAARDRILQRCSGVAFTRYWTTSSSMMTGPGEPVGNAGGFGRMGTTLALLVGGAEGGIAGSERGALAGGEDVRRRGGGIFGAAMVFSCAGTLHSRLYGWAAR
jgi:hypothetical protein